MKRAGGGGGGEGRRNNTHLIASFKFQPTVL